LIHGSIFSKPYNPAINDYETTPISCDELARAGIHVRNLPEVVSQLEAVLTYRQTKPPGNANVPPPGSHYLRIYYDLDAYKQPPKTP
jgi:hypothetical protein